MCVSLHVCACMCVSICKYAAIAFIVFNADSKQLAVLLLFFVTILVAVLLVVVIVAAYATAPLLSFESLLFAHSHKCAAFFS